MMTECDLREAGEGSMRLIQLGALVVAFGGLVGCGKSTPSKPVYTTRTVTPTAPPTVAAEPESVAILPPKAAPTAPAKIGRAHV